MKRRNDADKKTVTFVDVTLRDGEQAPGVAFTPEQKLTIARALDRTGVDAIETGFPAVSEAERTAIRMIASEGLAATKYALCRCLREDIDLAYACGVDAVGLFLPTSDLHLRAKFGASDMAVRKRLLTMARDASSYAKGRGLYVAFGCEDGSRTDPGFMIEMLGTAVEAGADRIAFADTVGILTPERTAELVTCVKQALPETPFDIHCHNDFGLATINTIAAVIAGADEVHVSVNGIGERAGNAPLEEVAVALKQLWGFDVKLDTTEFTGLSRLVGELSGIATGINKPMVGINAFSHESGIHTAAILKDPATYEPYPPELVGNRRQFVFGKHSGRHGLESILTMAGEVPSGYELDSLLTKLKDARYSGQRLDAERVLEIYRGLNVEKAAI